MGTRSAPGTLSETKKDVDEDEDKEDAAADDDVRRDILALLDAWIESLILTPRYLNRKTVS